MKIKIKKIVDLCVKSGAMHIYTNPDDGIQWMTDGSAIYPLEGIPVVDGNYICALYDITDKKAAKMAIETHEELPQGLDFSDTVEGESPANIEDMVICTDGMSYVPILTEIGQIFIDNKYLSPLSNIEMSDLHFYLRHDSSGKPIIAVKQGMLLIAMIYPIIVSEMFVKKLERIYKSSDTALKNQVFNSSTKEYET